MRSFLSFCIVFFLLAASSLTAKAQVTQGSQNNSQDLSQSKLVEKQIPGLSFYLGKVTLVYDPKISRPHVVTASEQIELDGIKGVIIEYVLETKLDRSGQYFVVMCDSGASDDFGCSFKPSDGPVHENGTHIMGVRFEVPGDSCVYASGHNNTMFNLRRKFCLDGDRLREVEQPYHYVGLKSKTKRDLKFYQDISMKQAIGTISKGGFVEVLIANVGHKDSDFVPSHDYFLIRDRRGLTGWVNSESAQNIHDVFFAGD